MREPVVPHTNFVSTELRRMQTVGGILGKPGGSIKVLESAVQTPDL